MLVAFVPLQRGYAAFQKLKYHVLLVYVINFYCRDEDAAVFWLTVSELGTPEAWGVSPVEAAPVQRIHPQ